jgi:NAD-dependent deacetylase sirtuin 5
MRPSVVLFAEPLYQSSLDEIEEWFEEGPIDLVLVIGTNASVHPAAGYIYQAIEYGARVAVVNVAPPDEDDDDSFYGEDHWYFQGDAAELLPILFKDVLPVQEGVT